jgi:hypothetical protein
LPAFSIAWIYGDKNNTFSLEPIQKALKTDTPIEGGGREGESINKYKNTPLYIIYTFFKGLDA